MCRLLYVFCFVFCFVVIYNEEQGGKLMGNRYSKLIKEKTITGIGLASLSARLQYGYLYMKKWQSLACTKIINSMNHSVTFYL